MRKIEIFDPEIQENIVREARTWVGTPYGHQGRLKGRRVDCIGLILEVGLSTGLIHVPESVIKAYGGYSRQPNPKHMGRMLSNYLTRLDIPADLPAPEGCIAWLAWRSDMPMHLAIMSSFEGRITMIHAWSGVRKCCEHGFTGQWCDRVHSWWAFPPMVKGYL